MALLLAHSAARATAPEISLHSGAASVVLAESAPSATERILRSSRSLPKQLWPGRKAGDNERALLQKRVVVEARAHGGAGCAWRDHRQPRPAGRHLVVHVQVAPMPRGRAAGRGLPARIEGVACKPIERQKVSAIRIGRLLPVRKGERGETLRAMGNDICSGILWPRSLHNK